MHLAITIFYNDIIFGTVLKAIRAGNLSVFRWLELILEMIPGPELESLFKDYRRHTETELWKDRKELEAFIQKSGTIERYVKGEIGFNLLYTFKARALTYCVDGMVSIVKAAVKRLCAESGQEVGLADFFDFVVRWDAARMAGIVKNLDREITETFSYDISRFSDEQMPQKSNAYVYRDPVTWRFYLTEEQKDYIQRNLKIFGDDPVGIGRVLSNSHTKNLLRHPVPLDRSVA
jgi:hypothetical protein